MATFETAAATDFLFVFFRFYIDILSNFNKLKYEDDDNNNSRNK